MSDEPMKAEYVDRIDRLTELAEAEREVQAASTKFEQAQWEVVKAAEHLQEWTNVWKYRRESVLSRFPDTLTPEQITFYGQGNRLSEANEVLRQFCASVEAKNKQLSALTPPLQHKGGETEADEIEAERAFILRESELLGYAAFGNGVAFSDCPSVAPIVTKGWRRGWCEAQRIIADHWSSCSLHNLPAMEPTPCDCGVLEPAQPPISTLQASSGEGETTIPEGFIRHDGRDPAEYCPSLYKTTRVDVIKRSGAMETDTVEFFEGNIINDWWHNKAEPKYYEIVAFRVVEAPADEQADDTTRAERSIVYADQVGIDDEYGASPAPAPTEPAAYSPVNNADEPVTKPEADVFAHGIFGDAQRKADEAVFEDALSAADSATDAEIDQSITDLKTKETALVRRFWPFGVREDA